MGFDTVELVAETEETFGIDLPIDECALVFTVSDLYRLVLRQLDLPYLPESQLGKRVNAGRNRYKPLSPWITPWTTPDVWVALKSIIMDKLWVESADRIHEFASFQRDLGCD